MSTIALIKNIESIPESSKEQAILIPEDRIKILPTEEEKRKKKANYRKEYRNREQVKRRREEYLSRPEVKIKREAYSKSDKVKERKKFLSKLRRTVLKCFITEHGDLWEKYKAKCEHELLQKEENNNH